MKNGVLVSLKFIIIGILISLVLIYLSLELLPKDLTVLPSIESGVAIAASVVIGFVISAFYLKHQKGK
jgi:hypothetical protein